MPYATNHGLQLFWDEAGSGTPVLLVMGATYSSRMWYPVVDTLATRHRVIWFDNRGTGQSQASKTGSIEDMASDAAAVLDAAGVDRAHIYGVSLGGVVTLQFALQSPERVRSLVLGCTGILSDEKPRAPKVLNVLAYIPARTRRRILGRLGRRGYGSAASESAVAKDMAAITADRASSTGIAQQQNALRAYSVQKDAVRGLDFPALVLHGTEDRAVPHEVGVELAEALPRSRFVSFEGAGHNYLVVYPEKANAEVLDFLAEAEREDLDTSTVDP